MPWITKDTASDTVDRSAEHQLTDAMKSNLTDNYLPRFETTLAALLPALHMIQHHYGWVSRQAMLEIAEFLDVRPADVYDTATFYEEYWTNRKGDNLISVCRSIACEFCNATPCTEAVKSHLGIDVGETTPDNKFTLVELECLGSCGTAPVALINEDLHENLTPDELIALVKKVQDGTYTKGGTGAVKGQPR